MMATTDLSISHMTTQSAPSSPPIGEAGGKGVANASSFFEALRTAATRASGMAGGMAEQNSITLYATKSEESAKNGGYLGGDRDAIAEGTRQREASDRSSDSRDATALSRSNRSDENRVQERDRERDEDRRREERDRKGSSSGTDRPDRPEEVGSTNRPSPGTDPSAQGGTGRQRAKNESVPTDSRDGKKSLTTGKSHHNAQATRSDTKESSHGKGASGIAEKTTAAWLEIFHSFRKPTDSSRDPVAGHENHKKNTWKGDGLDGNGTNRHRGENLHGMEKAASSLEHNVQGGGVRVDLDPRKWIVTGRLQNPETGGNSAGGGEAGGKKGGQDHSKEGSLRHPASHRGSADAGVKSGEVSHDVSSAPSDAMRNAGVNSFAARLQEAGRSNGALGDNKELFNSLVQKARVNLGSDGSSSASIRMNPRELGNMTLNLQVHQNRLHATLLVENDSAKEALMKEIEHLRSELRSQGVHVEAFTIQIREPDMQQMSSGFDGHGENLSSETGQRNPDGEGSGERFREEYESNLGSLAGMGTESDGGAPAPIESYLPAHRGTINISI